MPQQAFNFIHFVDNPVARSFVSTSQWKMVELGKLCTRWKLMQKIIFFSSHALYCIDGRTQLHYLKNASTIKEIRDRGIRYVHVSAKRRRWKSRTGCSVCSSGRVCAWSVACAPAPKITVCLFGRNKQCISMRNHLSITLFTTVTPPSVYQKHNMPFRFFFFICVFFSSEMRIHVSIHPLSMDLRRMCAVYTTAVAYVSRILWKSTHYARLHIEFVVWFYVYAINFDTSATSRMLPFKCGSGRQRVCYLNCIRHEI